MTQACGATRLQIYGDSNLVVQQTMKECDANSDNMVAYRDLYEKLEASFDGCELHHIGRGSNEEADELANIGSTRAPIPPGVFLEQINERSIKIPHKEPKDSGAASKDSSQSPKDAEENTDAMEVEEEGIPEQVFLVEAMWTRPFIAYLARGELPEDRDRKSTRLNSSHSGESRMPSSA